MGGGHLGPRGRAELPSANRQGVGCATMQRVGDLGDIWKAWLLATVVAGLSQLPPEVVSQRDCVRHSSGSDSCETKTPLYSLQAQQCLFYCVNAVQMIKISATRARNKS